MRAWNCPRCGNKNSINGILCDKRDCRYKKGFINWICTTSPLFIKLFALLLVGIAINCAYNLFMLVRK